MFHLPISILMFSKRVFPDICFLISNPVLAFILLPLRLRGCFRMRNLLDNIVNMLCIILSIFSFHIYLTCINIHWRGIHTSRTRRFVPFNNPSPINHIKFIFEVYQKHQKVNAWPISLHKSTNCMQHNLNTSWNINFKSKIS